MTTQSSSSSSSSPSPTNRVYLHGMGLRMPSPTDDEPVDSPRAFWELLVRGTPAARETPAWKWSHAWHSQDAGTKGQTAVTHGNFVPNDGMRSFDPTLFHINAKEAAVMDPQHRVFLECVWDAFMDACVNPFSPEIQQAKVGVYVGSMTSDHLSLAERDIVMIEKPGSIVMGCAKALLANRVSFYFGFSGPSLQLDTACSSSLVATDLAIQALQRGDIDWAVVGGTNWMANPEVTVSFEDLGIISRDGTSKFASQKADGYGRGEGVVVVLLRRRGAASTTLASNDDDHDDNVMMRHHHRPVYCEVIASVSNHDARKPYLAFPSAEGQERLIRDAYQNLDPLATQVLEAHGTGTPIGDGVELSAVNEAFHVGQGRRRRTEPLVVGSVKSIVGHTEGAAGVCSLAKAALCVKLGRIPPVPSSSVAAGTDDYPFQVSDQLHLKEWQMELNRYERAWPAVDPNVGLRRISVNSFGIGGSNAHVVLQQVPEQPQQQSSPIMAMTTDSSSIRIRPDPYVLLLSAHSSDALVDMIQSWIDYLQIHKDDAEGQVRRALWVAAHGRPTLPYRVSFCARTVPGLVERMQRHHRVAVENKNVPEPSGNKRQGILFVFNGQGSQWAGMGAALYRESEVFRSSVDEAAQIVEPHMDLRQEMFSHGEKSSVEHSAFVSMVAIPVLQMSLVRMLQQEHDIRPAGAVGHSTGEVAAAFAAGALDFVQAVELALARALSVKEAQVMGSMLAVQLSLAQAHERLQEWGYDDENEKTRVVVACENSPTSVTLSGPTPQIERLAEKFKATAPEKEEEEEEIIQNNGIEETKETPIEKKKIKCKLLTTPTCFHHPDLLQASRNLCDRVAKLQPRRTKIPFFSSTYGACVAGESLNCKYWESNLVNPVRFSDALKVVCQETGSVPLWGAVLEVGSHPVLQSVLLENLQAFSKPGSVPRLVGGLMVRPPASIEGSQGEEEEAERNMSATIQVLSTLGSLWCSGIKIPFRSYVKSCSVPDDDDGRESDNVLWNWTLPPYPFQRQHFDNVGLMSIHHTRAPKPHTLLGRRLLGTSIVFQNYLHAKTEPWVEHHKVQGMVVMSGAGLLEMALAACKTWDSARERSRLESFFARNKVSSTTVKTSDRQEEAKEGEEDTSMSTFSSTSNNIDEETPGNVTDESSSSSSKDGGLKEADLQGEDTTYWTFRNVRFLAPLNLRTGHFTVVQTEVSDSLQSVRISSIAVSSIKKEQIMDETKPIPWTLHFIADFSKGISTPKGRQAAEESEKAAYLKAEEYANEAWEPYILYSKMDRLGYNFGRAHKSLECIRTGFSKELKPLASCSIRTPDARSPGSVPYNTHPVVLDAALQSLLVSAAAGITSMAIPSGIREITFYSGHEREAKNLTVVSEFTSNPGRKWRTVEGDFWLRNEHGQLVVCRGFECKRMSVSEYDEIEPLDSCMYAGSWSECDESDDEADRREFEPFPSLFVDGVADQSLVSIPTSTAVAHIDDIDSKGSVDMVEARSVLLYTPPVDGDNSVTTFLHRLQWLAEHRGSIDMLFLSVMHGIPEHAAMIGLCWVFVNEHPGAVRRLRVIEFTGDDSLDLDTLLRKSESLPMHSRWDGNIFRVPCFKRMAVGENNVSEDVGDTAELGKDSVKDAEELRKDCTDTEEGKQSPCQKVAASQPENLVLYQESPSLAAFSWISVDFPTLSDPRNVIVEVDYVGLNFKDVMLAQGLLDAADFQGGFTRDSLGVEVSGRVVAVGQSCDPEIRVGTRVSGMPPPKDFAKGTLKSTGFQRYVELHWVARHIIPESLSLREAAAIRTAGFSAYFCVKEAARVQSGDVVLIHSAAGGVGLFATTICSRLGATVIATASTDEKRLLCRNAGAKHTFSSRSLEFVDGIRALYPSGVDVVINSLYGAQTLESVRLLAPFGRFIEIGKRDAHEGGSLPMAAFRANCVYLCFDLDRMLMKMLEADEETGAKMMESFYSFLDDYEKNQEIYQRVIPIQEFPASEVAEAFKFMAHGSHSGKVVVRVSGYKGPSRVTDSSFRSSRYEETLRQKPATESCFIVTGGTSGLGLIVVQWLLVRNVARNIVVLSRTGPTSSLENLCRQAEARVEGCCIQSVCLDVSDETSVKALMERIHQGELFPSSNVCRVAGVVHAAGLLADRPLLETTDEDMAKCMNVKLQGARLLSMLTTEDPVKMFLCMSSVAALIGNRHQAAYAAANCALDSLCEQRRKEGKPGISIQWGPIADAGMVARDQKLLQLLSSDAAPMGLTTPEQVTRALDRLLLEHTQSSPSTCCVATLRWLGISRSFPFVSKETKFKDLIDRERKSRSGSGVPSDAANALVARIAAADTRADKIFVIQEAIRSKLVEVTGNSLSDILPTTPLAALGISSLRVIELRSWASKELGGIDIPLNDIGQDVTVEGLATTLLDRLEEELGNEGPQTIDDSLPIKPFTTASNASKDAKRAVFSEYPGRFAIASFIVVACPGWGMPEDLAWAPYATDIEARGGQLLLLRVPGGRKELREWLDDAVKSLEEYLKGRMATRLGGIPLPVILLGHSMGAIFAIHIAARLSCKVTRVIIAHMVPFGIISDAMRCKADEEGETAQFLHSYIDWWEHADEVTVSCPVTSIWSPIDTYNNPKHQEQWSKYTTDKLEVIEGDQDHSGVVTRPSTVTRELILKSIMKDATE